MENIKPLSYFDDIRPYDETEAVSALHELANNETFIEVLNLFFPEYDKKKLITLLGDIKSVFDFQKRVMHQVVKHTADTTAKNFTYSGIENIEKDKNYVFISNHRDIFLDSAFLMMILVENGLDTTEITFGNNLMKNDIVRKVGKINKMFKVYRKGKPKELFEKSKLLSEYIRYCIQHKKQSVWIAQKEGRTKNGKDRTQISVLKMLAGNKEASFAENIRRLNIVPVSISYEYEPCDIHKATENFISQNNDYIKSEDEDLNSIINGVKKYKGDINLAVGKPINDELDSLDKSLKKNEQAEFVARIIDKQIVRNYKLMPSNYIAADMISGKSEYKQYYTEEAKERFVSYINETLQKNTYSNDEIKTLLLEIYANPVFSKSELR